MSPSRTPQPRLRDDVEIDCVYRVDLQGDSARCLLLSQILNVPAQQCVVSRPMCAACIDQTRERTFSDHPIFPSLVYQFASEQMEVAHEESTREHWQGWTERAEAALLQQVESPPRSEELPACDVILGLTGDVLSLQAVIESVLSQIEVVPILHLIDFGIRPMDLSPYVRRWNVQRHDLPGECSALEVATQIVGSLRTPFLAVQHPQIESGSTRLADAIRQLRETGAELFVEQVAEDGPITGGESVEIIPSTLVLRRALLVDMPAPESGVPVSELRFIEQALGEGRPVVISEEGSAYLGRLPTVRVSTRVDDRGPRRHDASRRNRFPRVPVRCDVVLPFRGQLNYVRQALESLLSQENATPIIHLIDDATPEDTREFLHEWAQHPQLRVYRNRENVGQFQSFNNVAPYWETDLVAVQDSDDISLPHRLAWAGQMLHWSGADYFGGAVELFGDDEVIRPVMRETDDLIRMRRAEYRRSFYPQWQKSDYFLENPTAVFRTAMFREMGGYADFGDRLMNRTSLDTEFQLRCLFRGVRFCITRDIVTRYRVHPASATQDRQTGWGTSARAESIRQVEERCQWFRRGNFDPRSFGAIGRYTHVTQRWESGP